MDNVNSFLFDWAIRFLENKDTIRKEIINIEKNENNSDFIIHYKDKVMYFIIKPILEGNIFSRINVNDSYGIFTLNNAANVRFVVTEWRNLVEFKFLRIYFINPFSSADKVWAISPYIHDRICDKASLELGLKSMAEMVMPIGVEELSNKLRLLKEAPGQ